MELVIASLSKAVCFFFVYCIFFDVLKLTSQMPYVVRPLGVPIVQVQIFFCKCATYFRVDCFSFMSDLCFEVYVISM